MKENETPEHLELGYRKVTCLNCSHALITKKTDANMGFINHTHIVVSVSDSHRQKTPIMVFDHFDHVCFLLWRDTAADDCLTCFTDTDKVTSERIRVANDCKCLVLNHYSSPFVLLD